MSCPSCQHPELERTYLQGVAVARCPRCGGAWLARPEVERLFGLAEQTDEGGDSFDFDEPRRATERSDSRPEPSPRPARRRTWGDWLGGLFD